MSADLRKYCRGDSGIRMAMDSVLPARGPFSFGELSRAGRRGRVRRRTEPRRFEKAATEGDGEAMVGYAAEEICFMAAAELARRIASRELSPVDVVDAFLRRIDAKNPALNAYVTL